MSPVNSDVTSSKAFDTVGNAPVVWFESAMDLLLSSGDLKRTVADSMKDTGVPFRRSFWAHLMLRAFALECLFKCQYLIDRKRHLCEGGRYIGMFRSERHDLKKMAAYCGFGLSTDEAHMLDRLTAISVGVGRYPIFKSHDQLSRNRDRPLQIQWSMPDDDLLFHSVLSRLATPLDKVGHHKETIQNA